MEILQPEVFSIFSMIMEALLYGLEYVLWLIFVSGPLWLLSGLMPVIEFIGTELIGQIIFGSGWSISSGFQFDGENNRIGQLFFRFFLISAPIFIIIVVANFILYSFKMEDATALEKWKKSLVSGIKGLLLVWIVPAFFWILTILAATFAEGIRLVFGINKTEDLYTIIYVLGNTKWDGTQTSPEWFYAARQAANGFMPPSMGEMRNYEVFVSIIGAMFVTISILILSLIICLKVIELVALMLIFPIIGWAMIKGTKGDEYLSIWNQKIIGKFISITSTMFSFYLFMILISIFVGIGVQKFPGIENIGSRMAFMIVTILATAAFTIRADQLFGEFIGETGGLRDALAIGAMAKMGSKVIKGVGKAGGLGKTMMSGTRRGNKRREERSKRYEKDEGFNGVKSNSSSANSLANEEKMGGMNPPEKQANEPTWKSVFSGKNIKAKIKRMDRSARPDKFSTRGGIYGKVANTISTISYATKLTKNSIKMKKEKKEKQESKS